MKAPNYRRVYGEKEVAGSHRFDVASLVGIVSLPIIVWHGCMMREANLQSRAANQLNARQFDAAEQHLKEERLDEDQRRKSEMRPLLAINSAVTNASLLPVNDSYEWDSQIEIVNVGKGIALDVTVTWIINPDRETQAERLVPRHLTGSTAAKLTGVPRSVADDVYASTGKIVFGTLKMKAHTVDGDSAISEQSFTAKLIGEKIRLCLVT